MYSLFYVRFIFNSFLLPIFTIIIIIIIVYYAEAAQYTAARKQATAIKRTKNTIYVQTRFKEQKFFHYHMQHQQNVPTCET